MSTDNPRPARERYARLLRAHAEWLAEETTPEEDAEEARQYEELKRILQEDRPRFRQPEDIWTPEELESIEEEAREEAREQALRESLEEVPDYVSGVTWSVSLTTTTTRTLEPDPAPVTIEGLQAVIEQAKALSGPLPPLYIPFAVHQPLLMLPDPEEHRRRALCMSMMSVGGVMPPTPRLVGIPSPFTPAEVALMHEHTSITETDIDNLRVLGFIEEEEEEA